MQAIILAAGESSRFWPLSENNHKSLVKIMGKSLIQWVIESLKESGLSDIIIIESPEKKIEKALGDGKNIDVNIKYVVQREPKGMGNAIMQAEKLIVDDFFVLNPNYVNIDLITKEMIKKKRETNARMILLGSKTNRPWDYGIVEIEKDKVKKIIEKPEKGKEPSDIKVNGIYLLPKEFFEYHKKVKEHMYSYEDALQSIIENDDTRIIIMERETATLKHPWDIFNISKEIMDLFINKQNISKSAQISKNVIIEGNVWIGENTKIYENAVIKGPCYIGNNCIIGNSSLIRKYSNIEDNVIIGANAEVSNTIIQENTHLHSGFFGDSIIGNNCKIGAGSIFANRRIDRKEIISLVKGKLTNTGFSYFGSVIGNNTCMGICVSVMPGIIIGNNVIIGPNTQVRENIESNIKYYTEFKGIKKRLIKIIKTIIFDADNTLYKINQTKAYEKLYEFLSKELDTSKEKISEEYQEIMDENRLLLNPEKRKYSYGLKILFNKYNYQNEEAINRALDIFWDQIIEDLIIIPGMLDVLEKLKKKFRFVIASDEFASILEKKLNKVFGNWKNYFDFIVTPESVYTMKPSQKYYQIVLEKTSAKINETVVVGDSWNRDLEPAKSIDIKTILISDKKQGYPDFWIKNIEELLEILENMNESLIKD